MTNTTSHALRHFLRISLLLAVLLVCTSPACAAKVLILGDLQYPFVAGIADEIRSSLRTQTSEYPIADIKGRVGSVVDREGAEVVIALGADAVAEALRLPPEISVVYGLVLTPPRSSRTNLTGVYMSPSVPEYISTLRRYFPAIGRVSVIGSPTMIKTLSAGGISQVSTFPVNSSVELINTVSHLPESGAVLLLPDVNLLTSSAMENIFAYSFRKSVPLIGVSEASVKQGSLFALVFDAKSVGSQISEKVREILNGDATSDIPASPPGKYNLFINSNTARKMGISVPADVLRRAKKVYQ